MQIVVNKINATEPGDRSLIIDAGRNPAMFDGHFPGHPILPGAKLLDLVIERLQVAGVLPAAPIEIASAKFLSTVAPGSRIRVSWTVAGDGSCRFECAQDDRKIANGVFRFLQPVQR